MKLYTKITDARINVIETADAMAKASNSIITVVGNGRYLKVTYLLGRWRLLV